MTNTNRTRRTITARGRGSALVAAALALTFAGSQTAGAQAHDVSAAPNQLSRAEQKAGWRLLFDGKSFAGWRGLGYPNVPTAHWKVEDGAIRKVANEKVPVGPDGKRPSGGDLMTVATFKNFELEWDWKMSSGGNSGLKYNVSEELSGGQPSNVLRPATGSPGVSHSAIGFEYQVLDDSLSDDNKIPSHRAGSLYDLIPPSSAKKLKPVGQWNSSRIVFRGNHGEHWLNGVKVVEFELGTARMDSLLAKSKYHTIPGFADRRKGHIILQDHGDEVYYRNIKIRELTP